MARGAALVGLLAWLAAVGSAAADTGSTSERDPFARARERGRPVIVWMTAHDCDACRAFERDVLTDRRVVSALDRVVFETVELGADVPELRSARLDVDGAPALVAFDPDGYEIGRRQGDDLPARVHDMLEFVDLTLGRGMDWDAVRKEVGRPPPLPPSPGPVERVELTSLNAALDRARYHDSLVLIEFGAEWCAPCERFEKKILSHPAVVLALMSVQVVHYDVDTAEGRWAHELYADGERRIPSFVLLDPNGAVIDRTVGSRVFSPQRFVSFVRRRSTARTDLIVGKPGSCIVRERPASAEFLMFAGYGGGLANHVLVGAHALLPLADERASLWPAVVGHAAGGFTTDGEPVADVNVLAGAATTRDTVRLGFLVGTGLSQVGDAAPMSFQVPFEISVDIDGDVFRGAAWARAIWLAEEERKHGSDNAPLGTDEIALGIGVRLPARSPHGVWVGLSYRELMDDHLLSFTFGTGSAR